MAHFSAVGEDGAVGLRLPHDQGSQQMPYDLQRKNHWLVIVSSPAFIWAPESNGCNERFIRTFQENLLWVRTFESIEDLQQALAYFWKIQRERWLIEHHEHRSPAQFRRDRLDSGPIVAQPQNTCLTNRGPHSKWLSAVGGYIRLSAS